MKKFLVLFTCQKDGQNHQAWKSLSIDQQKERMNNGLIAREEWNKKYKKKFFKSKHFMTQLKL